MINQVSTKGVSYPQNYEAEASAQLQSGVFLLDQIKRDNCEARNILELGCGVGTFTHKLQENYPESSIEAIDISAECIQFAEQRYSSHYTEYKKADFNTFIPNKTIDLLTSNAALQWSTDIFKVLKNVTPYMAKSARIHCAVFGPKTYYELGAALSEIVGTQVMIPAMTFSGPTEIESKMKGLISDLKLSQKTIDIDYPSINEALRAIQNMGVRGEGATPKINWTRSTLTKLNEYFLKEYGVVRLSYDTVLISAKV